MKFLVPRRHENGPAPEKGDRLSPSHLAVALAAALVAESLEAHWFAAYISLAALVAASYGLERD